MKRGKAEWVRVKGGRSPEQSDERRGERRKRRLKKRRALNREEGSDSLE